MGQLYRDTQKVLKDLEGTYPVAILVGGSAFYLKALHRGLFPVSEVDEALEHSYLQRLEAEGSELLYQELQKLAPEVAKGIHPKDKYRIYRALTLYKASGKSFKDYEREQASSSLGYPSLKIGLFIERELLKKKVESRLESMIERGLEDEVRRLLEQGLKSWKPLESIGYKEVIAYMEGLMSKAQMKQDIISRTMSLAKRQATWFRKEEDLFWFQYDKTESILNFVKSRFQI